MEGYEVCLCVSSISLKAEFIWLASLLMYIELCNFQTSLHSYIHHDNLICSQEIAHEGQRNEVLCSPSASINLR